MAACATDAFMETPWKICRCERGVTGELWADVEKCLWIEIEVTIKLSGK